jgi:signal transduction histidine kinase
MTALAQTRREIEKAWHSFVTDGRATRGVRPEILRSWKRVRKVDPRLRICPTAARAADALARADADGTLGVASSLLAHFADRLKPGGHVAAYFDADGVMLALDGNARTLSRLADVNFTPGSCWAERTAGTNGPGTALAVGRAVEVFSAEHFVEAWQPWNCASVPVRFAGRVVGAVDITSPWKKREPGLLLTAEVLAHAIEARLEAEAARAQNAILLQVAHDALRARDDFLRVASHELKTPLTPLRMKVQQVQRLLGRAGDHSAADGIAQVLRGVDGHVGRLVGAIDRLLEASRVLRDPLRPVPELVELGGIVRAAVERRRRELERHGCTVTVEAPSDVVGCWDPELVAQAFDHLLSNAIRYAPGRIDVAVEADHARARVRVRDRGPGIARRDQERIFQPYERAVSSSHSAGFGLGLYAVRQVAEAHGGSVSVESAPGEGCAFDVELPLDAAYRLGPP